MRVFVAYGYNARDKWIEEVIFPVIEAFGSEPVHGGDLAGQPIPEAVRALINSSDALIAFATRRDPFGNGEFTTHRWVTDELAHAIGQGKQVIEVREQGVIDQGGIAGNRQHLEYQESERLGCVVEIVKTLGQWHRRGTRRFQLIPDRLIRPHLSRPYFRCRYKTLEGLTESAPHEVPVQRIQGGLFINASGLSPNSLVQVEVVTDSGVLFSDYTSIDAITVQISE